MRDSQEFLSRVRILPKNSERVFPGRIATNFHLQRKNIAHKLANPRLLAISLTTFRNWKLTKEAHRTRDPFDVMKISGHKSMDTIMFYIDLAKVVFIAGRDNEFTSKVAANVKEACSLIESGFEYVTGDYDDGGKLFRKRKIDYDEAGSTL